MFSWSITKSAEAMFSRWAIKRICKFLLKRKLGKFILGDIDLDQLDVQLGAGTIQLSDLALNVDYINEKLGTTAVLVKEGSVGSLMVIMPWKDGGCRIEVDELEIVLAPRGGEFFQAAPETSSHGKIDSNSCNHGSKKQDMEGSNSGAVVDVHEGVKTIAKMVKWLLTSFHVKIKKLIVAFDSHLGDGSNSGLDRILVLRVSNAECGTHISEDDSSSVFTPVNNFLGFSRLKNYVKFEGAVLELLHADGLDHQAASDSPTEATVGNWFSEYCSSGNMTTIISGECGGFSGNLTLSIPWRNGSLDIRKVDADLQLEPLELRLKPSTIKCFIFMWGMFKGFGEESKDQGHYEPLDDLSAPSAFVGPPEKGLSNNGDFIGSSSMMEKEPVHNLLSESHLISNWVSRSQKDTSEEEPDFGASVDQFFECFDGLRNSQSALGNSGMWNWSCSVFSAITAASNLASGSFHVSSEQQHVETNFNASIAKVSLLLSFSDEDQNQFSKVTDDKANSDSQTRHMCTQFINLFLTVQVRPSEMNFEVIVQQIQLVDHLCCKNDSMSSDLHGFNDNSESEAASIQKMQDDVQGALLAFQDSDKKSGTHHRANHATDISPNMQDICRCRNLINGKDICGKDATVTMLKTSAACRCIVRVNLGYSGASVMGPTTFTLKFPPFVCWLNFDQITMMLQFVKDMTNCMDTTLMGSGYVPHSEVMKQRGDQGKISHASNERVLEGHVYLLNARIFLCFPPKNHSFLSSISSSSQFIAFEFVSPIIGGNDIQSSKRTPVANSDRKLTATASCSLTFNFGDFYLFSISPPLAQNIVGSEINNMQEGSFSVEKIISVVNRSGLSIIRMLWQEGPATGPWIAKTAKLLASSDKGKDVRKSCEFASVTTVKDSKNLESCSRQEIISSSAFLLHGNLPTVTINLGKSQYVNLCTLISNALEHFSFVVSDSVSTGEEHSESQTSIFLECESVTISMAIEPIGDACSVPSELPGSWSCLTLQVNKFELLSVSNIGGMRSASFLWVAHGQGNLWGSITEGVHHEFLLLSCCDSTMGRGGGEGSNVLSSKHSGSVIINFCDPDSKCNSTLITIRGATVVAIGGRLDWFTAIFSFFSPPSSELEQKGDDGPDKKCGSSFLLHLVDVGLSYEPYFGKHAVPHESDKSGNWSANESSEDFYVACILAASSLKLSSTSLVDCNEGEYKIGLQDLGLLIRVVPESGMFGNNYSVDFLRKTDYVKVAEEAHIEALFRTNCENGHSWELECGESHSILNTCHDTMTGLIRLASQLQKLFAPDLQEYIVHLENRWNKTQQMHDANEKTVDGEFSPSFSQVETLNQDKKVKVGNLMDEIFEDVFQVDGDGHTKSFESQLGMSDSSLVASGASSSEENVPMLIEEYFLSDLRPLSGLALKKQSSDLTDYRSAFAGGSQSQMGNGGWYADTPLKILENHASKLEKINVPKAVDFEVSSSDSGYVDIGKIEGRIILKNMNVVWRMYGGSDWSSSFQNVSHTLTSTCSRDVSNCLELALCGIEIDYDVYPDGEMLASRLFLSIQDICLNDRSHDAPWKLVLGHYQSKKHPRESFSKAVKLNLEAVRPDPSICIEENRLRIAILPMRLHLYQSQLDFLVNFFGGKKLSPESSPNTTPWRLHNSGEPCEKSDNVQCFNICEEAFLPYFQKFEICPTLIRVDYSPCRVDLTALRGGKYVELINLVPWKGVELHLKQVQGVGLYGWASVCETILGEWLEHISQNQIHKLLKGLPPIKSLFAVGAGASKLISLPVKSYKKDHRLLKGMQRGTFAFLRSISLEAIGLGVHLAAGAHDVLLHAEYILASIPPSVPWPVESKVGTNVKFNQPNDAQQGIEQAYQSIRDGLGKSASALVQAPLKKYQRGGGVGSALATAIQSAPAAAMAPASGAARAVHCALLGFRNSLDPERKRESLEKYMGRTPSQEFMQC